MIQRPLKDIPLTVPGATRFDHMKRLSCYLIAVLAVWPMLAQTPPRRLVMISVDGLMPATLQNAEKLGIRIPNLMEFRDKGAFSAGLVGVFPTVTYPSHTTMMTGRLPAEHGIISNTLFDPERAMNGAWYWYSELIKVPTLWQAARQAGLTTGAVGWPVSVGAAIDYNFPEYGALRTLNDTLLYRSLVTPGLLAEFEKARGPMRATGGYFDDLLSTLAAYLVESRKPHLLLVHLIDLDHDQHLHGPGSPESLRTLERIDGAIGKIREAVDKAGVAGGTRWIIVSDHGFFPVEKAFHPEAFLTSLGLGPRADKPSTWRVSAHVAGGSAAFVLQDSKDTEARNAVTRALKNLKEEGTAGIDRVLSEEELRGMQAYPHAFAAISMTSGWTVGSERSGPWVTPSPNTRGTHGYAPGPLQLDCTFIAFGPGIQARQLPRGELTDVAVTAASLLGIPFPGAGGRNLLSPEARTPSRR